MPHCIRCQFCEHTIDSFVEADLFVHAHLLADESFDYWVLVAFGWLQPTENLVTCSDRIFFDRLSIFSRLAEEELLVLLL